ncbi:MAG: hypothetical protein QOC85_2968, partial [Streptomyces sp.]|nr:hypothetical protein [Streptomyces sp.]
MASFQFVPLPRVLLGEPVALEVVRRRLGSQTGQLGLDVVAAALARDVPATALTGAIVEVLFGPISPVADDLAAAADVTG